MEDEYTDQKITDQTEKHSHSEEGEETDDFAGGKFLTFLLDKEEYGVEILKVREIIGLMEITQVPQTENFVQGVINLRGKVIPVIDLRKRFKLQPAEYTEETCIIVVDVGTLMGIIVDTVREVHSIPASAIDPAPQLGLAVNTDFILGMGKVNEDVKLLLDIDRVLTSEGLVKPIGDMAA
jgi:purine-binding chemotaxis protein CheW